MLALVEGSEPLARLFVLVCDWLDRTGTALGRGGAAAWTLTDGGLSVLSARQLAKAAAMLGQDWSVPPCAALPKSRDSWPACNSCGPRCRGCQLGDKGSVDVSLWAVATQTGLLDL